MVVPGLFVFLFDSLGVCSLHGWLWCSCTGNMVARFCISLVRVRLVISTIPSLLFDFTVLISTFFRDEFTLY